jgi:probable F420-dependent oxidoreductase
MAHGRTFRFGVQSGGASSAREWREKARKIEDLGYSTFFMPDHFIDTPFAPMGGIAMAAEATESLRVGTLVLGNDYKHPAIVAKEFATLDVLSDGRVEAGIGAGWMRTDYDALGLRYDRPGIRIDRLAEALAVLKGAWGPEPFSFEGEHYNITSYDGLPKPVQQPHPPILVGGGGRKLLTLAAREADIIGFTPAARTGEITTEQARETLPATWTEKFQWVREAAGEHFDDLELQIRYFFAAITDDRRGLAEAAAPAFGISADEALQSGVALVGTVDECCDLLVQRREEWGVSYIAFGDNEYEAFAPVVARLAGA